MSNGNGGASAIVDVGHGAGNGACSGDAAEDGRSNVGNALSDELGVRVVVVANDTISHCGREQRLYSTEDCNGDSRTDKSLDDFPRQFRNHRARQL